MKENIELEYKTLVNEEQFHTLMSFYPPTEEIVQINHYFDDELFSDLNQHHVIRVREFVDSFEFTMKYYDEKHNLHEISKAMNSADLLSDPDVTAFLQERAIDVVSLKEFACLKTIRKIFRDGYGELCFDENYYGNTMDYEIEYEMIQETPDFFERYLEIIKKADIKYQPSKPKIMRCFLNYSQSADN